MHQNSRHATSAWQRQHYNMRTGQVFHMYQYCTRLHAPRGGHECTRSSARRARLGATPARARARAGVVESRHAYLSTRKAAQGRGGVRSARAEYAIRAYYAGRRGAGVNFVRRNKISLRLAAWAAARATLPRHWGRYLQCSFHAGSLVASTAAPFLPSVPLLAVMYI